MKRRLLSAWLEFTESGAKRPGFFKFYIESSIKSIRFSFVLAIALYLLFSVLDIYMAPESKEDIWVIRFIIKIPILFLAFLFTYSKNFIRFSQQFLFVISLLVGLGIILMISMVKESELAYRFYYCGLILEIIWSHTILRLKLTLAALSSTIVIVSYNLFAIFIQDFKTEADTFILVSNDFFLISAYVLGIWSTYTTERMVFKNYTQAKQLTTEKEELAASKHQLDELNGIKSKLISIISHDLRSPISGIKGILQLYNSGYITDDEFKEHAKQLHQSLNSTDIMLENLLSWSVLQIERHKLVMKKIFLSEVVQNVFTLVGHNATKKNVELINSISKSISLEVEPTMIELVIRNLVTNAIKFTQDGKVEVRALQDYDTIQIAIEDTGIGIPEDIANKLFTWSKKVSCVGTQLEKGTGIGLLICKEFIEKHSGSLTFVTDLKKGTTFFFTIPMSNTETNENLRMSSIDESVVQMVANHS